jgi:hypothetical protein
LELAINELLQGMEDLEQLELVVDELLEGMEELEPFNSFARPLGCRGWRSLSSGSSSSMWREYQQGMEDLGLRRRWSSSREEQQGMENLELV